MTTNDQLILTGEQACVRELCWQIYRFNLHVISNHTPYLQTLGFHGRIRVTTDENNGKVGRKCHMLHDQCCPALIENDAVRFENSLHNTHTKIRNETSTSREDWISEFTEPKEQGYWILTPSFPQSRASLWQIVILWHFGTQTVCTSHIGSVGPRAIWYI